MIPGARAAALAVLVLLGVTGCSIEPRPDAGADAAARQRASLGATADTDADLLREVETMLHASAASWNAGDLDGFIDDYSDDPDLIFLGGSGIIRGVDAVRTRYETGYWADGGPPDSLRFEALEARPLGSEHALVVGRYVLYQPTASDAETTSSTGWFSLVLERDAGEWRILHDHSSAAPGG
ncbi:MAG: nuclear transport factor 2 family protein [Longimicrobiales bacterium]|nr:nuclear transport factor 2 family protein [Longimicrobiales bacterium]